MNKQDFFNLVRDGYYEKQETTLEEFCEMYRYIIPIGGILKTKVELLEEDNTTTKITFIDEDIDNDNNDMSGISMIIYLDENNIIKTIEHGLSIFTPANKDLVLFYGSLIGKEIKLLENDMAF